MEGRLTACVVCQCTEDAACPGSCSWWISDPPLCSRCGEFLQGLRSVPRAFAILRACGVRRGARSILVELQMVRKPRRRRRPR